MPETDTFTYKLTDGKNVAANDKVATVTVTINPKNDPPQSLWRLYRPSMRTHRR